MHRSLRLEQNGIGLDKRQGEGDNTSKLERDLQKTLAQSEQEIFQLSDRLGNVEASLQEIHKLLLESLQKYEGIAE